MEVIEKTKKQQNKRAKKNKIETMDEREKNEAAQTMNREL